MRRILFVLSTVHRMHLIPISNPRYSFLWDAFMGLFKTHLQKVETYKILNSGFHMIEKAGKVDQTLIIEPKVHQISV